MSNISLRELSTFQYKIFLISYVQTQIKMLKLMHCLVISWNSPKIIYTENMQFLAIQVLYFSKTYFASNILYHHWEYILKACYIFFIILGVRWGWQEGKRKEGESRSQHTGARKGGSAIIIQLSSWTWQGTWTAQTWWGRATF